MDGIVEKAIEEENIDTKNIVGLAPFLSKETVKKIADYMLNHGQEKRIIAIAPFMGKLDDLDEDDIKSLLIQATRK